MQMLFYNDEEYVVEKVEGIIYVSAINLRLEIRHLGSSEARRLLVRFKLSSSTPFASSSS